jgi:hypothetical protein
MTKTCPQCGAAIETYNTGFLGREHFEYHGDCPGGFAAVDLADTELESRYTAPSEACPHPERWHSPDWDSTEGEVTNLVAAFVAALRPDIAVETGSAFGQTAAAIGWVLAEADAGVLHTIEPSPERAEMARQRCKGMPVEVHETTSLEWEPVEGIGFAWLDSLLDLRVPEFRHLYPHFAPHAFVGFHDTADHQSEGKLWHEILGLEQEGLLLPIRLPTPRGVVFAEVLSQ